MIESSRPLRVCLVAETFYPAYAGGAIQFQQYLPGLRRRSIDVCVFCATPTSIKAQMVGVDETWRSLPNGKLLPIEEVDGTPVHRVRLPDVSSLRRTLLFGRALVDFCRQPRHRMDVVQFLSLSFENLPALFRLRHLGIPMVFTSLMQVKLSSWPLRRALQCQTRKAPAQLVDRIVASSEFMADELRALGVDTDIEIMAHGVDLRRFRPAGQAREGQGVRRSLGIGAEESILLFVGSVTPRKGIDLLLEMWVRLAQKYPRTHLVIVGPRRDRVDPAQRHFHERLEALRVASGAPERVHYVGFVENVDDFMRAADVFLFPSKREGQPNAVLEAMASGLPVVSTPFLGLTAEFGEPGRHYLLADRDPESFTAAVERVLCEQDLREGLARSGRGWVEEHMNVDRILDRYASLYREVAGNGARSAVA